VQLYSFFTLVTRWGGRGAWLKPRPVRLTPRNDLVPTLQEAGWPSGPVSAPRENLPPYGLGPRTIQHLASCYTNCTISAAIVFMWQVLSKQATITSNQDVLIVSCIMVPISPMKALLLQLRFAGLKSAVGCTGCFAMEGKAQQLNPTKGKFIMKLL
jgi:hypothetical protein